MRAAIRQKNNDNNKILIVILLSVISIIIFGIIILKFIYGADIKKFISKATITFENLAIDIQDIAQASLYAPTTTPETLATNNPSDYFKQKKAMVIGDSTVEGLDVYQGFDSSCAIWTRGRSVLYLQEDVNKAVSSNPTTVFLAYGANDLLIFNGNVTSYINAYQNAIDYVKSVLPNARICVNSILPVSDTALQKQSAYKYEEEFNTALKKLCDDNGITYIDNRPLLDQSPNGVKFEGDGVHPKPFYYKLWANNMITVSGI